jgi:hypothetical protein
MCRWICRLCSCYHGYALFARQCKPALSRNVGTHSYWCIIQDFDEPRWIWDKRYKIPCLKCVKTGFEEAHSTYSYCELEQTGYDIKKILRVTKQIDKWLDYHDPRTGVLAVVEPSGILKYLSPSQTLLRRLDDGSFEFASVIDAVESDFPRQDKNGAPMVKDGWKKQSWSIEGGSNTAITFASDVGKPL